MRKTDFTDVLTERLAENGDAVSKKVVKRVVDEALELITETLAKGESVTLTGFGTFEIRQRSERMGTNPTTKERMLIPAKKAPAWAASEVVKRAVEEAQGE